MMFKPGDRVRMSLKGRQSYSHYHTNPHDLEGVVEKITCRNVIHVIWSSGHRNDYLPEELELVPVPGPITPNTCTDEPTKPFFMLYIWGNSFPTVVHITKLAAEREATRLARLTGKRVYIMESVATAQVQEPPVQIKEF